MSDKEHRRLSVYGLDLRSIGLFRILTGLAMFLDIVFFKFPNVADIYSRTGFYGKVYEAQAADGRPVYLNLFHSLGSDTGVYIFFAASALVYLLYTVGFCTRLLAPLSVLLFCITRESNPLIDLTPDLWFLFTMFWAMFLPLGARFTLFGRGKQRAANIECRSFSAYLLLAAISLVYFVNGYTKLGGDWFTGDILRYWLRFPPTRGTAGMWLVEQPALLVFLEYATVIWELVFPLFIFSPWFRYPLRWVALASILLFHFGNLLFIIPGYYCVVGTCLAAVLLPGSFWARWFPKSETEAEATDTESDASGADADAIDTETDATNTDAIPGFLSLSPLMKGIIILRNVVLSACFALALVVNLDELPAKIHLREDSLHYWEDVHDYYAKLRTRYAHVDLFRFLIRKHAYYPAEVPERQHNLIVLGVAENGRTTWNLVSGELAEEIYWGPNPDFRRPYFAIHRGAYFNPTPFKRYKIFERWLAKLTRDWNHKNADKQIAESLLGMIELDPDNKAKTPLDRELLARWRVPRDEEN